MVVPAYNEERLIGRCLDSLAAQDFAGPFEVLVVDNGSTDGTADAARARGVRVLHEPRKGVCFARQTGTLAAAGEYVANLDADSYAEPDWLRRVVADLEAAPEVVAVAGTVDYLDAPGWAETQAVAFRVVNTLATRRFGGTAFVMASNLAFRRAAFDQVGGYNLEMPTIGDEADFLLKLRGIGRIPFDPDAVVRTSSRRFRRGFWHFVVVELGYQTIYAYVLARRFHRTVRRARADIREPASPATGDECATGDAPAVGDRRRPRRRWPLALALGVGLAGGAFFLATRPRSQVYGRTAVRGPRDRPAVALTFDDGPAVPATAQVLDILRHLRAPATFFLVGENVARHPDLARRIVAEGHTVGNHTQRHRWRDALLDSRYRDLDRAERQIAAVTGVSPRFFRPPLGIHTPWQLRRVRRRGMVAVQWSADADDPHRPGADVIARRILDAATPGAIVLLHDGEGTSAAPDRSQTVAALPATIRGLRARGLAIVPLGDLLGEAPYRAGRKP
ncbi:MAG TPA: polysaccharide deacetylase family protein [Thermomicrobiales bacterium]|nr:polysaccharide deacetylase family protein [Thermomicrobiales bacterium]